MRFPKAVIKGADLMGIDHVRSSFPMRINFMTIDLTGRHHCLLRKGKVVDDGKKCDSVCEESIHIGEVVFCYPTETQIIIVMIHVFQIHAD